MTLLTTCLWFDTQAEEAAHFYVALFPNSKVGRIVRYSAAGPGPEGQAMTVDFELDGAPFFGLNGGPVYKFSPATSFSIACADQKEIDRYWDGLLAGGGQEVQCGWLTDRFGVSWQVVPKDMPRLMGGPRGKQVAEAMFKMKKLDVAKLEAAAAG